MLEGLGQGWICCWTALETSICVLRVVVTSSSELMSVNCCSEEYLTHSRHISLFPRETKSRAVLQSHCPPSLPFPLDFGQRQTVLQRLQGEASVRAAFLVTVAGP